VQTDDQGTLITETGWSGPERVYRVVKDAEGRTHESYRENGQPRPVDEAVRRWAEATLLASRWKPPMPPVPPQPPPPPPAPPTPSGESLLEPAGAAFGRAQAEARLIALVGTPITREPQVRGSIRTWGPGEPHGFHLFSPAGGARTDVTLVLHGPRGSALLHAQGERRGSEWHFSRLEAQPSLGGPPLNLVTK
jgi:hypothetical protein